MCQAASPLTGAIAVPGTRRPASGTDSQGVCVHQCATRWHTLTGDPRVLRLPRNVTFAPFEGASMRGRRTFCAPFRFCLFEEEKIITKQ